MGDSWSGNDFDARQRALWEIAGVCGRPLQTGLVLGRPATDVTRDRLGPVVFDIGFKNRDIEPCPFELMRGRSHRVLLALLDGAPNTSAAKL